MKRKINILFLTYSFPPAQAPASLRIYFWVKYLNRKKFNITVLAPRIPDSSLGYFSSYTHSLGSVNVLKTKYFNFQKIRKLRVNKVITKTNRKRKVSSIIRALLIPDKGITWVPFLIPAILEYSNFLRKTDVIITSSPLITNHLVMLFIKRFFKRAKWIADIRDLIFRGVNSPNKNIIDFTKTNLNNWIEKNTLKYADAVIFVTESMKSFYEIYYPEFKEKFNVIYNGFDYEEFRPLEHLKPSNEEIKIYYSGSFYEGKRDPLPLLISLNHLKIKNMLKMPVNINIAGNISTGLYKKIMKFNDNSKIKINYLGILERPKALEIMKRSHFMWLIVPKDIAHSISIPTKTFEYFAAKRFILSFSPIDSEVSTIIKKLRVGEVLELSSCPDAVKRNAEKLGKIFCDFEKIYDTEKVLDNKDLRKFNRKFQTKKLENIIVRTVGNE